MQSEPIWQPGPDPAAAAPGLRGSDKADKADKSDTASKPVDGSDAALEEKLRAGRPRSGEAPGHLQDRRNWFQKRTGGRG